MPRETIDSIDVDDRPPRVNVTWGPDTYVQIATTTYESIPFWWQVLAGANTSDEVTKRLDVLGALLREVVHAGDEIPEDSEGKGRIAAHQAEVARDFLNALDTTYGPMDGMYVSLDRRRINDLIRVLRRARDSAYGRDE